MADDSQLSPPRIICAAIRYRDGLIVAGPRHWDRTMGRIADHLPHFYSAKSQLIEQGFIDQHGTFYTRREAWKIAQRSDQIITRVNGDYDPDTFDGILYSENLY